MKTTMLISVSLASVQKPCSKGFAFMCWCGVEVSYLSLAVHSFISLDSACKYKWYLNWKISHKKTFQTSLAGKLYLASALPSCGHNMMPYYSVREKSERGMHAWVPAALYPSPDSHMKSRERGGRCSLGRSGDPHLSSTTTPPGAPPYVRLNNGPLDQHHLWPYQ